MRPHHVAALVALLAVACSARRPVLRVVAAPAPTPPALPPAASPPVTATLAPIAVARPPDVARSLEERWLRAAVSGSDAVLRIRVGATRPRDPQVGDVVEADVLERLRGALTSQRIELHSVGAALRPRLREGAVRYLVAIDSREPTMEPSAHVPLALFDDTPADRARLDALMARGWRHPPLVMLARAIPSPSSWPDYRDRLVFDVERVLRGTYASPRITLHVRSPRSSTPRRRVRGAGCSRCAALGSRAGATIRWARSKTTRPSTTRPSRASPPRSRARSRLRPRTSARPRRWASCRWPGRSATPRPSRR